MLCDMGGRLWCFFGGLLCCAALHCAVLCCAVLLIVYTAVCYQLCLIVLISLLVHE